MYEIEGLKTGEEYTVREVRAPKGYTVAPDFTFTIDEEGEVTSTGSVTEEGVLLVEDVRTHVRVSKVDADGRQQTERSCSPDPRQRWKCL